MNPKKVLTMYRLCKQGKYQEALKIQEILQKFFTIVGDVGLLRYTDAAIDKTMGLSAGFLQGYTNTIKRPYSTPPKSLVDELRGRVAREIPELLEY
jgi:hypothetical protein